MKKITGRMAAIAASIALTTSVVSLSVYALNRTKGDVTGDGKVTQADAVWAARKADGQDIGDVSFDELAADVDFNGKFDSADAQAIAKYVAGWNDTSVGDSITESDPVYTLSIKYRDDIDKSVQKKELEDAVADDEELMERFLEGEFGDLSDFTKVKGGLTLEEAYALARKLPDFNVDIDAGGEKAPMIITEDINGFINDENITSVTLTAKVAGGKAPYTYKWYKGGSEVGTNATYTSGVTGDNYDKEVYCLITDADGKTIQTNKTKLKNVLYVPLTVTQFTGFTPYLFYAPSGDSSLTWEYKEQAEVKVTIDGGSAPYLYQWYIDGEKNYGPYTTNLVHVNDGISSSEKSCTVKYDIDKVFGKKCKCVITDSAGNTIESQPEVISYVFNETSPLDKYTASASAGITCNTAEHEYYNINAYFKGGSLGWNKYEAEVRILKENSEGTRYFSTLLSIPGRGYGNAYYTRESNGSYCLNIKEKIDYFKNQGMITSNNNCQVVITDPLTNSTLSYILTLN